MDVRSVVGYDGSEPSRAALRWALDGEAPVVVAHVIDADDGSMGADFRREVESRAGAIIAEAQDIAASHRTGRAIEVALLDGPVAWALAEFARPGDVIVIGTHKTGFLHGRVLGSRSVEVALLASCDVVVVPDVGLRFRSGVAAGVADEPDTGAVVRAAARVAAARGEELLLVHGYAEPGADREHANGLLRAAQATARETVPDLVIRTRASNRSTAELLLDAGRDRALIVLGSGIQDRARSPIGSVLHDVLLNITTPTLVVHAPTAAQAPA